MHTSRRRFSLRNLVASAPGRADFLNTHQDYKGLPVVPAAINLRARIFAKPTGTKLFKIRAPDLEEYGEESFDSFEIKKESVPLMEEGFFGNYFRAVVNVLLRKGFTEELSGVDATIKSEIPIGSGLASSAAIEVAFTTLINRLCSLGLNKREIAEVSFEAENVEMGIPCGRLDQYGVSFGDIIKLECRPPYRVELLPFKDLTFVIIDSGIRHSTGDIHPKRQDELERGLKVLMDSSVVPPSLKDKLGYRYFQPIWEKIGEDELKPYMSLLDDEACRRILFTIKMQRLTEFALKVLKFEELDRWEILRNIGSEGWKKVKQSLAKERAHLILGFVMNEQHTLLRDYYDLSTPELEEICRVAIEAGAYGAKISGAGLGGSIIALVKDLGVGRRVVEEALRSGAKKGWVSTLGDGAKIENR
ncbi:TPA: GHMP kinase [Candidatus Bathyarchaeota archaeon]|nr:GHMP kinase [Candidatus Bathyarchaeota archaeon]